MSSDAQVAQTEPLRPPPPLFSIKTNAQFMEEPRYEEACEELFRFMDQRGALIQRTVVQLTPVVAAYKPDVFVAKYLNACMAHLLNMLRRDRERPTGVCWVSFCPFLALRVSL